MVWEVEVARMQHAPMVHRAAKLCASLKGGVTKAGLEKAINDGSERLVAQFAFVLTGLSTTIGGGRSEARSPPRLRRRMLLLPPAG